MPIIINQLDAEISEPAEITPEPSAEPGSGNPQAAACLRDELELLQERAERLKVD